MGFVTIHRSGTDANFVQVDSYHNGGAYNVSFGEAGTSMRNVFLQGDDALVFREQWDAIEARHPDRLTFEVITEIMDDYL